MKHLSLLIILCLSCANVNYKAQYFSSLTDREKKDIQCRIIFTDHLTNDGSRKPLHDYHDFDVSENDSIYVYIKYFNLYRKTYFEKVNLMDSTGQIVEQSTVNRNFSNSSNLSWNCWHWFIIRPTEYHNGVIKAKAFLNNEFLGQDSFSLKIKTPGK